MSNLDVVNIVFVLFDRVTQLDFTAPAQALSKMPGAKLHVAAAGLDPVMTDCGFAIVPTVAFADCPQADIICVPGGFGVADAVQDAALMSFVKQQATGARWVTSVCTGAFVLGKAGFLQGRRATTHWAYTHLLEKAGATHEQARIVRDGNVVTCGGVTAGLDFALELIAQDADEDAARTIQLAIEYDPAPPFDCGHPSRAPTQMVERLQEHNYRAAASHMAAALG